MFTARYDLNKHVGLFFQMKNLIHIANMLKKTYLQELFSITLLCAGYREETKQSTRCIKHRRFLCVPTYTSTQTKCCDQLLSVCLSFMAV